MFARVFSGGGSLGALQAGANLALCEYRAERAESYSIDTGVSVGSINSAYCMRAVTPQEQLENAQNLITLWHEIDNDAVRRPHLPRVPNESPLKYLALLRKRTLYSLDPLRRLLRRHLQSENARADFRDSLERGRRWGIGAVSLETGLYRTFDESLLLRPPSQSNAPNRSPDVVDAIQGSSAFPGILEYARFSGQTWTDGGLRQQTPISTPQEWGATRIDVMHIGAREISAYGQPRPWLPLLQDVPRMLGIALDDNVKGDIARVEERNEWTRAHESVVRDLEWLAAVHNNRDARRFAEARRRARRSQLCTVAICFLQPVNQASAMEFHNATIRANIKSGYEQAKAWIQTDDFLRGRN